MKVALCIMVSQIFTFGPLGNHVRNYTSSVQEMPMKDCEAVKKAVSKFSQVICVAAKGDSK